MSPLQELRRTFQPQLPDVLHHTCSLDVQAISPPSSLAKEIEGFFPNTKSQAATLKLVKTAKQIPRLPKRVGVVLSGGQASGGHNVIAGLYDALKTLNKDSHLIGFLNGPKGICENQSIEITEELLDPYRNQGGFDLIGSGRTKIETEEQLQKAKKTVEHLALDGLVIIGGDDSNTNAALLAEYFTVHQCKTAVIGVPKTIDGDLKTQEIEISFGFDTACKTYAEIIGNVARDILSSKKYYFFVRLMGRSASHVTLECALQTHPNITLIGEEIAKRQATLQLLVTEIADTVSQRSLQGKDYGLILLPEGIIEFIPECQLLLKELNQLLAANPNLSTEEIDLLTSHLSPNAKQCFLKLPPSLQTQLMMERDAHGNVQVSQIETERLLIEMVKRELLEREKKGLYKGSFTALPLFCGYEGRSALPSNFDATYCYALGHVAAQLVDHAQTGYLCSIKNLAQPVTQWEAYASSIVSMLQMEERSGKKKPVIKKALVDLNGAPFAKLQQWKERWRLSDDYLTPGPIQFFGPSEVTNTITHTLALERGKGVPEIL